MSEESNIEDVEQSEANYDEAHYDSKEEEVIDWYRHYMSIKPEDLAAEYLSRKLREDEREVPKSIEMAAKDRVEEIENEVLMEGI